MTEAGFTWSVTRLLPKHVHVWKINARYTAGVPDAWYSGPHGDLWVEYKYKPRMPKQLDPTKLLSPRQRQWLNARSTEGRDCAVIVGAPEGSIILTQGEWNTGIATTQRTLLPKQAVANWLTEQVG